MPSLDGFQVMEATIAEPSEGAWTIILRAEMPELPSGEVTLEIEGQEWTGNVFQAVFDFKTVSVLMVGGSGKLGTVGDVRDFVRPTVRSVVAGILAQSGDTLSPSSDSGILSASLPHFHTSKTPLGMQLSSAIGDAAWYTLRGGDVEIAEPNVFAQSTADSANFLEQTADGPSRSLRYAVKAPLLAPRTTFEGMDLTYVETLLTPGDLTQVVYL